MIPRCQATSLAVATLALAACQTAPRLSAPPVDATVDCTREGVETAPQIERDPSSSLDFNPTDCRLVLAGSYALAAASPRPPVAVIELRCTGSRKGEVLLVIYSGPPPLEDQPLTGFVNPLRHQYGPNGANRAVYESESARSEIEHGELRFHRGPRSRLELKLPANRRRGGPAAELGLDLLFEGGRRFRAAMRLCPEFAAVGPVSDPID